MPPSTTEPEASAAAGVGVNPQLPWASIPKFTPGITNVQEYTQKLKFLAAMWPSDSLELLAPRAALLVEGTAFRKVARLDPAKLKVANLSGIQLLVEAIGGSWGSTELEERYEFFEKALYGTVQRPDESHDSYLARMENNFIELLTRNTKLEEVQAYVLLRQSTLSADDKKRILLEHEGELKYKPVVKAFRLLGSRFFNEFRVADLQPRPRSTMLISLRMPSSHLLQAVFQKVLVPFKPLLRILVKPILTVISSKQWLPAKIKMLSSFRTSRGNSKIFFKEFLACVKP